MNHLTKFNMVLFFSLLNLINTSCSGQSEDKHSVKSSPQSLQSAADSALDGWNQFRGPTGMGVGLSKNLPVKWNSEENLQWKVELPGAGSSSPIVYKDKVYVTCYSGYLVPGKSGGSLDELKRHLVCLNLKDGKIEWDQSVKAKLPEEESIRDHGFAGNTPIADSEFIYVFHGKSGVIAYDHQGNQQWQADVGSNTHGWGSAASPILYKNLLIVNASVESESIIALDRKTGERKWSKDGIKESWNTPIIVKTETGDDELVLAIHGKILGLDPNNGKQLWSCDTDITWYMVPSGVEEKGVVYYLGGRSGVAALAVKTGGRGDVTSTHRVWTSQKGSNVTSPVVLDGYLYWMNEKLGIAYCAKTETGELVYEERLARAGQVYASSILVDGKIYYLNRSGKTFVVSAKPKFELLGTNDLRDGTKFDASPVAIDRKLLIRSNKTLYCVGE